MTTESIIFYQMSGLERFLFTAIPLLAVLGLLASIGITCYRSAQTSKQWRQDQAALPSCIIATVRSKRMESTAPPKEKYHKNQAEHIDVRPFASFTRMDGAPPLEFSIPVQAWAVLCEGSVGQLCFRGRSFIRFTPDENEKNCGEEDSL